MLWWLQWRSGGVTLGGIWYRGMFQPASSCEGLCILSYSPPSRFGHGHISLAWSAWFPTFARIHCCMRYSSACSPVYMLCSLVSTPTSVDPTTFPVRMRLECVGSLRVGVLLVKPGV